MNAPRVWSCFYLEGRRYKEWTSLVLKLQDAEQDARRFGLHESARAINTAMNVAGAEYAEQLGDGGAARRYREKRP